MATSVYPVDNQFAGLVEAATAAAGQEVEWSLNDSAGSSAHQFFEGNEGQRRLPPRDTRTGPLAGQYDPSLTSLPNNIPSQGTTHINTKKRKRAATSIDAKEHFVDEASPSRPTQQFTSVHSAAALFRASSNSSKKYTRPPMSKLFSSLHLPPEEFLQLQSAAKAYMLDDGHPERRDCVGQRGKTDSDMVKLKLWHCVKQFLDEEGNGERFFGVNAPKLGGDDETRSMTWPENAQQIIKICIPLLRRMVTNERQRQYAVESRKCGGDSKREKQGQDAKQSPYQASKATLDGTDNPESFTTEKIDMFGDGLISNLDEASKWYTVYNSNAVLDKISIKSGFPRVLFMPLITNIDAHCRLYHGDEGPQCNESCRTRLVERLLELPIYQRHAPGGNPRETVQEVFHVVLTHLILANYWKNGTIDHTAISVSASITPTQPESDMNSSEARKELTSSCTRSVEITYGHKPENSLRLLIHIVHQDKCVLPPFDIPSNECRDLEALRKKIEQHYSLVRLRDKRVMPLPEATFKVWLPDGLVRVEDDGQWMVALLSAEKVEWMGGQIRVLLET